MEGYQLFFRSIYIGSLNFQRTRVKLFSLLILFFLTACGEISETITGGDTEKSNDSAEDEVEIEIPEAVEEEIFIDHQRKIRRYSIDLTHRLPNSKDFNNYPTPDDVDDYVTSLFASPLIYTAVAEKHRSIWNLQNKEALGEISGLASTTSEALADDVIETLKYHLSEDTPFSDLFKLDYSITTAGSSTLFGLSAVTGPTPDTEVIEYDSIRPSFGIASTLAITSSLHKNHDSSGNSVAYSFLKKFGCVDYSGYDSHNFSDFDDTYMGSTLRSVSTANIACASCHLQYSDFASNVPMFAPKTNLTDWTNYIAGNFQAGIYAGHSFNSEEDLAIFLSNDPRFRACETTKLIEEFLQVKLDRTSQTNLYARIFNEFNKNDNLMEAVRAIVDSTEYTSQVINPAANEIVEPEDNTGIRFLSRHHFKGLIESLVMYPVTFDLNTTTFNNEPTPDVITLSPELDLRKHDYTKTTPFIPDEIYMRRVYQLALDVSKKLVEDELSTITPLVASARKLLNYLPDGDGANASSSQINNQIISLWFQFTSINITTSSAKFIELQNIYDAGIVTSTAEAWRAILYAILISPEFLSY